MKQASRDPQSVCRVEKRVTIWAEIYRYSHFLAVVDLKAQRSAVVQLMALLNPIRYKNQNGILYSQVGAKLGRGGSGVSCPGH